MCSARRTGTDKAGEGSIFFRAKADYHQSRQWTLFQAITLASALSSIAAIILGVSGGKAQVETYVRDVVRGQQATILSFFKDSVSQQILVGDGPEVLRKCYMLLKESYAHAVAVSDLSGEAICDLRSPGSSDELRWTATNVYFDEQQSELASQIRIGFGTEVERRLISVVLIASFLGTLLLFTIQIVLLIPLSRKILQPIAAIARAVSTQDPEQIQLPELKRAGFQIREVQAIIAAVLIFLQRFTEYRSKLIESTRFETVARTVQIIAHDLKAPMAAFERILRISDADFAKEKRHLVGALRQLYSMTDAIKRAEFDDVVRLGPGTLKLRELLHHVRAIAEKHEIRLEYAGPDELALLAADQDKLERGLSNLLINAIEAAQSQVLLEIESSTELLLFRITDDGPGVPVELEALLFQRGATSGKKHGTGLGLFYVQRMAHGHGGDIRYQRIDARTVFTLELPSESIERPLPRQVRAGVPHETASPQAMQATSPGRRILILTRTEARRAALAELVPQDKVEVAVYGAVAGAYEIVLSEEWNLEPSIQVQKQKVLLDPQSTLEQVNGIVQRFVSFAERR